MSVLVSIGVGTGVGLVVLLLLGFPAWVAGTLAFLVTFLTLPSHRTP